MRRKRRTWERWKISKGKKNGRRKRGSFTGFYRGEKKEREMFQVSTERERKMKEREVEGRRGWDGMWSLDCTASLWNERMKPLVWLKSVEALEWLKI